MNELIKLLWMLDTLSGLIFEGFFNPWEEEISIPRSIRKSYILVKYKELHRESQKT